MMASARVSRLGAGDRRSRKTVALTARPTRKDPLRGTGNTSLGPLALPTTLVTP